MAISVPCARLKPNWMSAVHFGFKRAHGTEMAIFALKQTVDSLEVNVKSSHKNKVINEQNLGG